MLLHGVAFLSWNQHPSLTAQGEQRRSALFNIPRTTRRIRPHCLRRDRLEDVNHNQGASDNSFGVTVLVWFTCVHIADAGGAIMAMGQESPIESDEAVIPSSVRLYERISGQGTCLVMRKQQRVSLPPTSKLIMLRQGMLAVDAMADKEKLQVLDFMAPGDVISMSVMISTPKISLRAITETELSVLHGLGPYQDAIVNDCWQFLVGRCFKQLARLNVHQLMIGRLETEARVASFILAFALRSRKRASGDAANAVVELPMSRVDIANYLVINSDTLSRTMMRFCDRGLVQRVNRHALRVVDFDGLKKTTPISSLLVEAFLEGGEFRKERLEERTAGIHARKQIELTDGLSMTVA
jgi:CRP-like cAMP-binding protein